MADLLNKVGVGLGAVGAGVNAVSGLLGLGADGGQSKFAVSKLVSKLGELNGLQKTSLYLVEMSVPECLSGEYGASDMETMMFLCNSAILPGRTFAPIEYNPHGYGFRANRAGEPRVNDFTCTFFLDGKNFTLKYFNQYLNSMAYMDYSKNVDSTSLIELSKQWKDLELAGTATINETSTKTLNTAGDGVSYSASFATSASLAAIKFENLPNTVTQAALIGTGSLYLSGSTTDGRGQFLCVFTG